MELRGPLKAAQLYYLRNVTAGVFGGDAYCTRVACAPNGRARVESSSATKVYAMPDRHASVAVELKAEADATIVWGPHATILQAGSALRQETRVVLHETARVFMAETLVMGRIASGQRFDFASHDSALVVEDGCGGIQFRESYHLEPGPDLEAAMNRLGVLTTVYGLGVSDDSVADGLDRILVARPLVGWSRLPGGCGLIVKALSASLSEGTAIARDALDVFEVSAQGQGLGARRRSNLEGVENRGHEDVVRRGDRQLHQAGQRMRRNQAIEQRLLHPMSAE